MEEDDDKYGAWPKPPDDARAAEPIEVWTDGSSLNNGKPDAAAGAGSDSASPGTSCDSSRAKSFSGGPRSEGSGL